MTTSEKLVNDALSLPTETRLLLIEQLLASLNQVSDVEIDQTWAKEAEARIESINRGQDKLIPAEEVFARIREKYTA